MFIIIKCYKIMKKIYLFNLFEGGKINKFVRINLHQIDYLIITRFEERMT